MRGARLPVTGDTSWQVEARCVGPVELDGVTIPATVVQTVFFPHVGRSGTDVRLAKAICAGCTVSDVCLDFALTANEKHGIWGGHTAEDRNRIVRRRARERQLEARQS